MSFELFCNNFHLNFCVLWLSVITVIILQVPSYQRESVVVPVQAYEDTTLQICTAPLILKVSIMLKCGFQAPLQLRLLFWDTVLCHRVFANISRLCSNFISLWPLKTKWLQRLEKMAANTWWMDAAVPTLSIFLLDMVINEALGKLSFIISFSFI